MGRRSRRRAENQHIPGRERGRALGPRADVKQLVMFHYDQDYADDFVDELKVRCRAELDARGAAGCGLIAAHEGLTLTVG